MRLASSIYCQLREDPSVTCVGQIMVLFFGRLTPIGDISEEDFVELMGKSKEEFIDMLACKVLGEEIYDF